MIIYLKVSAGHYFGISFPLGLQTDHQQIQMLDLNWGL
jgi:hypothetical protein